MIELDDAGMPKSMPRVFRCIENDSMKAFWGMMKSEMYYLKAFYSYEEMKQAVIEYIGYYNRSRYQKQFNYMIHLEYRHYLQTKVT